MNEFLGYSLFMDLQESKLKAWNVYKTSKNMGERHGREVMDDYLRQHSKATLLKVAFISAYVKRFGEEHVKKQIIK